MTNKNLKNLPKIFRMKKRADFLHLRDKGKTVVTKSFIMQYAPSKLSSNDINIGFTATKKIGKATIRNRAKRRLKEVIAKKYLQLKGGYDIVLIARSSTAQISWEKLVADMDKALIESKLIKPKQD
ncbi:MAG: ribonuclease P protein component [Alphaproteobacteria bacterium]